MAQKPLELPGGWHHTTELECMAIDDIILLLMWVCTFVYLPFLPGWSSRVFAICGCDKLWPYMARSRCVWLVVTAYSELRH